MIRLLKLLAAFFIAVTLAACGGGGGSPGTPSTGPGSGGGGTGGTPPDTTTTAQVADIAIYTNKSAISNLGTDSVNVTVVAVNANRNAIAGATVLVSADKGAVFTPAGSPVTDATGTYTGSLTIGSDKSNRTIIVTATSNGISRQTTVQVADIAGPGSSPVSVADFAMLIDKTSIANNGTDTAVLTVVTVDQNRNIVAGAAVSVAAGANAIFTPTGGSNLTNASGIFTGTLSAGSDTSIRTIPITVTVNGIVKTTSLAVTFPPVTPPPTTTPPPTGPVVIPVTDMVLFMDKTTINNSGSDGALLTVVALDSSRNVVPGATVLVTTDANSVFIPTAGTVTNAQGTYTGRVSIGADKSNRVITLSVTINSVVRRTSVAVVGSKLTVSAQPTTMAPGQVGTFTALLQDSSLNAISGATITLNGTLPGASGTVVTDFSGQATQSFTAPATVGTYTIGASGSGVTAAPVQIQVVAAGVIPPAVIPAGAVPSLSASPNVLAVNSVGSTTNRATLRFLYLDGAAAGGTPTSGRPVTNVRVRFDDITTGLAALGASISSGTQTLTTDSAGQVTAQYISGQNSSPTNGVTIRACYSDVDPVPAPAACQTSGKYVDTTLTVAGAALAVSIGDDNVLSPVSGTYIKRFAITVADSAGRAVANAPVDISVDLTHYSKSIGWRNPPVSEVPASNPPTSATYAVTITLPDNSTMTAPYYWCYNEDLNRNGVADAGENIDGSVDANGQPTLQPRRSDMIISYDDPLVTTTNASGLLIIRVQYSQRYGGWLAYRLRVTANVAGSQGLAERPFVTDVLQGDVANGSFRNPAYGINGCRTPN